MEQREGDTRSLKSRGASALAQRGFSKKRAPGKGTGAKKWLGWDCPPMASGFPPTPDVLLSRNKRRSGPISDIAS
jgi:hypothetical protein